MVKQGDIIKVSFDPHKGHEQAGFRPALIISNDIFNTKARLFIVCPITNTDNKFPLHIPLDERTATTGVILCEHIKSIDLNSRNYSFVEHVPDDILERVIDTIIAETEMPSAANAVD